MRAFKYFPKWKKNLTIDFLRESFCLLKIYAQMLGQARDKISWMREAQDNISRLFGKSADLFYRKIEPLTHIKNAFRILDVHHLIFQRVRELPEVVFDFLWVIYNHRMYELGRFFQYLASLSVCYRLPTKEMTDKSALNVLSLIM